mgnify:CR=1 FL=1
MSLQTEGKLIRVFDEQQITDNLKKREFVIETESIVGDTVYSEKIKFQLVQKKCDLIDNFKLGDNLIVHFNLKGREWEKDGKINFFNSLNAWRIESTENNSSAIGNSSYFPESKEEPDALPF